MSQLQAFSNYQLQIPLGADDVCARYVALGTDLTPLELRIITAACQQSSAWGPLTKRLTLAGMVQHPAIQRVVNVEPEHAPPFVVLELRLGPSLAEVHGRCPLTLPESIQLGQHLARGLAEAHRLGIAAGNIQPATIVARLAGNWTIDVTGLKSGGSPDEEQFHQGGYSFAAPETSSPGEAEPASDVFSLAAVIEWLLPATNSLGSGDVGELRNLLRECRQVDPAARPTAGQFADRLLRFLPPNSAINSNEFTCTLNADGLPTGEPAPKSTSGSLAVPRQLGRFELRDKLGEGAMGVVYSARDVADGTVVAIKLLNSQLVGNPDSLRRFAKEARLLARANNPFVANLLEFNNDSSLHYLVVEFVPGGTVAKLLQQKGRLNEPTALALTLDVARGLSIAHQRGIVHRDIKPDNLLLTSIGEQFAGASRNGTPTPTQLTAPDGPLVKLSDFGLARIEQTESLAMTRDGALLGTPWYMSPEQCRGTVAEARSDVYALGATLYHLLAGRPPFEGDSPLSVINKHCHEPLPGLQQLRPELSDATARIVEKCLAKNPDARYPNAVELTADLEQVLKGEPTSMLLHPATPDTAGRQVLEFRFACDLAASPAQLWPHISNTDRINHALGLPAVTYSTRVDPQRGVERFAEMRLAGQRIAWQEHPFEWTEGRRMSVLREFSAGPFLWFVSVVELLPQSGGGTRLTQTLKMVPRNWLGRVLGYWELGRKSPRAFKQTYHRIDKYLAQSTSQNPAANPYEKMAGMSGPQRSRLGQRLERLREHHSDPSVVETLGQFLEHAPDQEVARIRPLVFAERFGLDSQHVVETCLLGAREGLLVLLWDILCPSCKIPADVQETLAELKSHSYCPACDLKYEIDFANSVELIFRAHPELRTVETRTYCIGGPAFSAHIVAQTRLAEGERFALELNLGEGAYRIRGPQLPFAVDFNVSPQGVQRRWELPLLRPPVPGVVPKLQAGSQVITLFNNTSRELQVRLERTAGRQMALTAAAASSLALFREMFPEQVLAPGQIVSVANVTLMHAEIPHAVELYQRLGDGPAFRQIRETLTAIEDVVRQHGGAIVKIVGEGALASFVDPVAATRAAVSLLQRPAGDMPDLRIAIHRGPALVTTLNDRLDYFGENAYLLREVLTNAGAGDLLLTSEVAMQPEVAQVLQAESLRIDIPPLQIGRHQTIIQRCRTELR